MRTFTKYLLLEAPGWALAALVAVALHRWFGLSTLAGMVLVALWIAKDFVLYRWVRHAYVGDERSPKDKLVGQTGVVVEPLEPAGIVRLGSELWRAEPVPEGVSMPRGRRIRVAEVHGLTLRVVDTEGPEPPRS